MVSTPVSTERLGEVVVMGRGESRREFGEVDDGARDGVNGAWETHHEKTPR